MSASTRCSYVEFNTISAYHATEERLNDRIFCRMFWTFSPCIRAFRCCKSLVQVDGTHLCGKYKGTLLVAVAQDGNLNILLVTFAITEGKIADA